MFRKENGVTLVALVITIIVLLILAGVTISMVLGDNGIIGQAKGTQFAQFKGDVKQAVELGLASMRTDDVAIAADVSNLDSAKQAGIKAATQEEPYRPADRLINELTDAEIIKTGSVSADATDANTVTLTITGNDDIDELVIDITGSYGTNYTATYTATLSDASVVF